MPTCKTRMACVPDTPQIREMFTLQILVGTSHWPSHRPSREVGALRRSKYC